MSALSIRFHQGGVYLPKLRLWLDPHEPKSGSDRVFVSHAHSDHIGLHREVILSPPTSKLMHARLDGDWREHIVPFGQAIEFTDAEVPYRITLLPAGHIFGSAMSLIEAGNTSLLYTGDFKIRPSRSAEQCEPRQADILITETTYGRPVYQFPPTPDVLNGIIRFCREAIDNEETPVLLGYSLGKSQELLCGLTEAGLPIMLHGTVYRLTKIYEQFGQCFPAYERYESGRARGKVLVCPPNVINSAMLRHLAPTRVAVLTGWAVDPNCRYRYQADAAFPMSDHADFPELLELVNQVRPSQIYTLHGFAADFAQTLREMGYAAQALSEDEQLALPLTVTANSSRPLQPVAAAEKRRGHSRTVQPAARVHDGLELRESRLGPNLFEAFAVTCSRIGSTGKKTEKVAALAEYVRSLQEPEVRVVSVWFTGRPFPAIDNKVLQLGWALIRDALCAVAGVDQSEFGRCYLKHSDLGETASELLSARSQVSSRLSIMEVQQLFDALHVARGPIGKFPILEEALAQSTPLEAKYMVKILTGDLRIGLKEGLVEEALAQAFGVPLEELKSANLIVGNVGETAELAKRKQLASAALVPFRPLKFMLASPEETAADIWERVIGWHQSKNTAATAEDALPLGTVASAPAVWVEDKYDGIRSQVHKLGSRVALYSRDLKEITTTFLDVADRFRSLDAYFILDGELVAMRGDQVLAFSELQKRLGRREGDLFLGQQIPVQFIAFDLLWLNGQSLLRRPLRERRASLEQLSNAAFRLAQVTRVQSGADIEAAFEDARARGNEGLMIKDPTSSYTPGRRGLAWLKLKKAYATLDCVVVGAEYGHGKRKSVLSDYTFAVRDEQSGEFKVIGKAYSGLTDAEIAELTQHFLSKALRQHGRYFEVEPDTVLEVAFDAVQVSDRHSSGLALRFPRIARIRTDKAPEEIDTLQSARKLVKASSAAGQS